VSSVILFTYFGKAGTTIERTIAKRYYSRLEKKFIDYPGYGLVDYVEKASSK
jgi:GTP-binding protein EngB required for normal cell division